MRRAIVVFVVCLALGSCVDGDPFAPEVACVFTMDANGQVVVPELAACPSSLPSWVPPRAKVMHP